MPGQMQGQFQNNFQHYPQQPQSLNQSLNQSHHSLNHSMDMSSQNYRGRQNSDADDPTKRNSYGNQSFRNAIQSPPGHAQPPPKPGHSQKLPPQVPPKPGSRSASKERPRDASTEENDHLENELKNILRGNHKESFDKTNGSGEHHIIHPWLNAIFSSPCQLLWWLQKFGTSIHNVRLFVYLLYGFDGWILISMRLSPHNWQVGCFWCDENHNFVILTTFVCLLIDTERLLMLGN